MNTYKKRKLYDWYAMNEKKARWVELLEYIENLAE